MKSKISTLLIILFGSLLCSQTLQNYTGFPILLDSSYGNLGFTSILTADIDKDGTKEIILASDGFKLRVIKSNGQNQNGFPKYYSRIIKFISCGDLDGNGYIDIVIRTDTMIYAYDRNGNNLPGFPLYSSSNGNKFASLYDLDNDGKLEIIADIPNGLTVYNFDGLVKAGWPKTSLGRSWVNPSLGDIDNDGKGEIIFTIENNYRGKHYVFKHDGVIFPGNWPITEDSSYFSEFGSPTLYIKDSNNDTSYICLMNNYYDFQTNNKSKIIKLDINGGIIKRVYFNSDIQLGQVIIGKDNSITYYVTGDYVQSVFLLDNNFNILNGWPKQGNQDLSTTTILGKISSEAGFNVVSMEKIASFLYGYGYINLYKINGEEMSFSPLRTYGIVSSHIFTDLDNNGSTELIIQTRQHLRTYLKVFTFPGFPYTKENFPWPVFGHDRYRTNQFGFIPPDEPIGIEPISNKIPDRFELMQNYPNPFNASTIIKINILSTVHAKLTVYDMTGRTVIILLDQELTPGSYRYNWNTNKLSSGVYFYELIADNKNIVYRETRKAVVVK